MQVRRSIRELEADYAAGNKKPLEDLIRAWKGIQELPSTDPNSFFIIAGYHGEPFRGAGWGNASWWGGYCNHGNVLFPTWHRSYCFRLEKALQSIPGCENVTLPYWDEMDDISFKEGLPPIFLKKKFELDGVEIDNPLYSYTFQAGVYDNLSPIPDADYSKPPGYTTVRYPFSGLVGTADAAATQVHNQFYEGLGEDEVNKLLNTNISEWLGPSVTLDTGAVRVTDTRALYTKCLEAPNYTVFSNGTSATQWNEDHFNIMPNSTSPKPPDAVVSLESPHNRMHLAIGGFEVPKVDDEDQVTGANGDMGENDTAGFDPIFFFHHCFVDKVFWTWQRDHQKTQCLDIIAGYPGTNSVDAQGPTPGMPANIWLGMETPLDPFKKADGTTLTSNVSYINHFLSS
jgi:tyrosinase